MIPIGELKEGSWLEQQRWGRDVAAALGRTTLTCLAFNIAQVYRLRAGGDWRRWPFVACAGFVTVNWAPFPR